MGRTIEFSRDHFHGLADREAAKALFKKSVTNVVIELFSYCNRRCHYCPVSLVDRISSNNFLEWSLFERIVADLEEIGYAAGVCLNLYNEPLAERETLLRATRALRAALPAANIYLSTNGDYLDAGYLADLKDAGLSEMYVTLHVAREQAYSDLYCLGRFSEFTARLGLGAKFVSFTPNCHIEATVNFQGMTLHVFSTNYELYGQTRAGLMKRVQHNRVRTSPCDRVFGDLTISYDGTIFPCCQLFADAAAHKQYAIGHLARFGSIFEAYASEQFSQWRKSLMTYGEKASPCDTCSEADEAVTEEQMAKRDALYLELVGEPAPPRKAVPPPAPLPPRAKVTLWRRLSGLR